jgi:cyclase
MKAFNRALMVPAALLMGVAIFGQDKPIPPAEGVDLSGSWQPSREQDVGLGTAAGALADYGGIPINEAGRTYALAWTASRVTVREEQCAGYVPPYFHNAPGNYRFWEERDPVTQDLVAIKMYGQISEGLRTIWMDGRPHPPAYAAHTAQGFSTGEWKGNVLNVYTTHIKRGFIRANGIVQTDEAELREHFIRHGDYISYFSVTYDPAYLAEPYSRVIFLNRSVRDAVAWLYACDDSEQILDRPPDQIPSFLYGTNPFVREYADKLKIPLLGAMGGPETMYPEFMTRVKDTAAAEAAAKAELLPTGPRRTKVAKDPDPHDGDIHVLHVQGDIYMLVGDGGNITVQTGDEAPLVVDTGAGTLSDKVIAEIRKLNPKPIQFIVNTSFHSDFTGGNSKLVSSGQDPSLFGSLGSDIAIRNRGTSATLIAHQNVQNRLMQPVISGAITALPSGSIPTDTILEARRRKYHNDEAVEIFWEKNASTDGDTIVQFRRSDVIVTGDIFSTTQYPFIDVKNGGSIQGEIAALDNILDRTVYKHDEEGGTMVIPGHGRLCDEYDVAEYREMVAIIRDRVQAMIKQGATLDQVKAARLTADYDPLYGAAMGPWTTDMFLEAVYTSLKQPPAQKNSVASR